MTKLDFLEVNRNFRSYYKTLRDVNYYLGNSELGQEKINATTTVITKLIFDFIRTSGSTFREMDQEKFEIEYEMFHDDFLRIIENSGVNNVDFDEFAGLLDELIGIVNHRMTALGKIKTTIQDMKLSKEDNEAIEDIQDLPITQMVIEKKTPLAAPEPIKNVTEKAPELEEEIDEEDESTFEGDDVFHYRPKRRRYR
jgi:hypothetical protein